ncbi:MAG: hypothetical protein HKN34_02085 [Gammaproteobacteria bacterium]|nr:hypothetical protein [Gammaproteobacteria bacterium]
MLGTRICLLLALVGSTSVATAVDYTVPAGVTVLNEEQLLTQVIGSTFNGGTRWIEYYEPPTGDLKEGTIKGKGEGSGPYIASWTIKDSLMCWRYKGYMASYDGCYTIALDGNNATFYKADGTIYNDPAGRIKLISGNPKSL